jgi:hypothetical protein
MIYNSNIMGKRLICLAVVLCLLNAPLFAKSNGVSLTATGYEWLGYSREEKRAFANLIHIAENKKKNTYNPEDVIAKLDNFYYSAIERAKADPLNVDEDKYLSIPCVKVIQNKV